MLEWERLFGKACELCASVAETPVAVMGQTQVSALVGANPDLSYAFLSPSESIKLLGVEHFRAVLHRTEKVGGFGMFLATMKAAGGTKCEFKTQNVFNLS